jgi:N-acylneuraminate cytidylyltransferase/CMP-N,N'-diacetyllegionaminic acid synthase
VPAIRHCAKTAEEALGVTFDIIVDLDVTAPLRSIEDISGAIQLLEDSGAPNVVTGMPASKSPYFNLVERDGQGRVRLSKTSKKTYASRQELPECFALNASVFAWTREALFLDYDFVLHDKTLLYVMPEERSLDIDSELEFRFVEFLMAAQEPTP